MLLLRKDGLKICFAHAAYQMAERFAARNTGIAHFQVRNAEELAAQLPGADVLVVSMLWKNTLAPEAKRLKFIQSISAGIDQYDRDVLRRARHPPRQCGGRQRQCGGGARDGTDAGLEAPHPTGRDNQARKHWRGMISEIAAREDELAGKTLLMVGLGRIGARLAKLAKAFDMKVVGTRRDPARGGEGTDAVFGHERLPELLGQADIVALACPLTPETQNLIDAKALGAMQPTAHLINVARGRVVDEGR